MLMNMAVCPVRINYPLARQALTGTLTKKNLKKFQPIFRTPAPPVASPL